MHRKKGSWTQSAQASKHAVNLTSKNNYPILAQNIKPMFGNIIQQKQMVCKLKDITQEVPYFLTAVKQKALSD